ncbi:MAG: alpha/beta hydrolase [Candidatus Micrarchaeota archaeon]|nr:alpha/beta hydrolase [Candidatus Micrarchaeota archaeon]
MHKAKLVIVHGWMGTPTRDWLAWVKEGLRGEDVEVKIPRMPNTNRPKIEVWNRHLAKVVGKPDENLFMIGHSIGGRLLLRYLEGIDAKIGGAIIVASWLDKRVKPFKLKANAKMMAPWLDTPIDWKAIKRHSNQFTAIYSDNDAYVPMSAAQMIKRKLNAKVIVLHNKGHIDQTTSPPILKEIKRMLKSAEKD